MLYLMLDKGDGHYFAKCGITTSPKKRLYNYKTHNPTAIMRSTCAGTGSVEHLAQNVLASMSIRRVNSSEWFEVSKEVFDMLYEKGMGILRPNQKPIHFIEKYSKTP